MPTEEQVTAVASESATASRTRLTTQATMRSPSLIRRAASRALRRQMRPAKLPGTRIILRHRRATRPLRRLRQRLRPPTPSDRKSRNIRLPLSNHCNHRNRESWERLRPKASHRLPGCLKDAALRNVRNWRHRKAEMRPVKKPWKRVSNGWQNIRTKAELGAWMHSHRSMIVMASVAIRA